MSGFQREPGYIYTISVQGHGAYPEEQVLTDPVIKVTGAESEEKRNQWEYYVNQLYEMDQFVEELITALSHRDEETVLVMYGDHLPTMGLEARDMKNGHLYSTEYFIWDNMGLEKTDKNLATYQMGGSGDEPSGHPRGHHDDVSSEAPGHKILHAGHGNAPV